MPDRPVRVAIVVTTINDGGFLDRYRSAVMSEQAQESVCLIVVPDLKSPPALYERCRAVTAQGLDVECPPPEEQEAFLKSLGNIGPLIPYNSDNRRNVGYLRALERGAQVVLSVDDDNLPRGDSDFIKHHLLVGGIVRAEAVHSSNGWFNICQLLDVNPPTTHPRGFPYGKRHQPVTVTRRQEEGVVHVNAGLWLGHPDVDAIDCLAAPVKSRAFRGPSVLLGHDTWSPINSQNTAVAREAMVAYYFFRMGHPVLGNLRFERYGDIFSGFFVQACARHLGKRVRIGTPIVDHVRNSHDYLRDLSGELAGVWMLDELASWLAALKLDGNTYSEAYLSLAAQMEDAVEGFQGYVWNDNARAYFHAMAYNMRSWVAAVAQVDGV